MNSALSRNLEILGLSEEIVGDARLLRLLEKIFGPEPSENFSVISRKQSSIVEFLRLVRDLRRFDLLTLCSSVAADKDNIDTIAAEFLLLYLDSGQWQAAYSLLQRRTNVIFPIYGSDLLNVVLKLLPASGEQIEIWPNERLFYAEKTAIINVSMAVILRQRGLIETLLRSVEKVSG
ncbi:MAG: hypothetical protein FD139_3666 [Methylocystaceae bacterium]|nr:MAG: hypothetical protein FD139_3666 [Methylocystaceae bacterium]